MQTSFGKDFFAAAGKLKNANDLLAVNAFIQKFNSNPANPGISLERVDAFRWRIPRDLQRGIHRNRA